MWRSQAACRLLEAIRASFWRPSEQAALWYAALQVPTLHTWPRSLASQTFSNKIASCHYTQAHLCILGGQRIQRLPVAHQRHVGLHFVPVHSAGKFKVVETNLL